MGGGYKRSVKNTGLLQLNRGGMEDECRPG